MWMSGIWWCYACILKTGQEISYIASCCMHISTCIYMYIDRIPMLVSLELPLPPSGSAHWKTRGASAPWRSVPGTQSRKGWTRKHGKLKPPQVHMLWLYSSLLCLFYLVVFSISWVCLSHIYSCIFLYAWACASGSKWKCMQGALGDWITKSLHTKSGRVRRAAMATNKTRELVFGQTLSQKAWKMSQGLRIIYSCVNMQLVWFAENKITFSCVNIWFQMHMLVLLIMKWVSTRPALQFIKGGMEYYACSQTESCQLYLPHSHNRPAGSPRLCAFCP